jgi:hypothetical protein
VVVVGVGGGVVVVVGVLGVGELRQSLRKLEHATANDAVTPEHRRQHDRELREVVLAHDGSDPGEGELLHGHRAVGRCPVSSFSDRCGLG